MSTPDRARILAFRLAAHNLSARLGPRSLLKAASACGIQETPVGSAAVAFAARVDGVTAEALDRALRRDRTLVHLWSLRGAPHVVPARNLGAFTAGAMPVDRASFDVFLGGWAKPICGGRPRSLRPAGSDGDGGTFAPRREDPRRERASRRPAPPGPIAVTDHPTEGGAPRHARAPVPRARPDRRGLHPRGSGHGFGHGPDRSVAEDAAADGQPEDGSRRAGPPGPPLLRGGNRRALRRVDRPEPQGCEGRLRAGRRRAGPGRPRREGTRLVAGFGSEGAGVAPEPVGRPAAPATGPLPAAAGPDHGSSGRGGPEEGVAVGQRAGSRARRRRDRRDVAFADGPLTASGKGRAVRTADARRARRDRGRGEPRRAGPRERDRRGHLVSRRAVSILSTW